MRIIIYTTPTCVYCRMAKDFFAKQNLAYEERDVAQDMKAREEMVRKSHQLGVPVIDMNGKIIVGFDRAEIEKTIRAGA